MKLTLPPLSRQLSWKDTFAALQHYNYRVWFLGQLVSLVGTWMQATAQGYLVYELTRSPVFLGYVGFAAGLPSWLFTLYGGVIADRVSRQLLLIITQSAMMLLAFLLAALVFSGTIQPWQIVGLAFLLGIANAFDAPARQAFVVELVDREDLTNAIALNSTMFNSGTVVGPAVAAIVYALLGPGWCFTINGISFIAVIIALLLIKVNPARYLLQRTSALADLKEGIQYVAGNASVRLLILNMGVLSIFGLSIITLLPAWSVEVLGGDVTTNGTLLSARGAGALIGALMVASVSRLNIKGKLWSIGSFVMPLMILAFAPVRWLPLSAAVLVGLGWSFMIQANTSNALVQIQVPDTLRGRVMSIFTLTFFGGMPVGALLAGILASRIGEPATLLLSGLILLGFAGLVHLRLPEIRAMR